MNLGQTFLIAWRALQLNPLRSFLTMLGVVIGVASVVAMVAIGEGAKAQVEASFASMGTNMLIITSGSSSSGGARGGSGSLQSLTWDDLAAIRDQVPAVRYVAANLRSSSAPVQSDEQNWTTTVYGTSQDFFDIRSWAIAGGSRITDADVDAAAKVAVLGATVVDNLFGADVDPIGQSIRIKQVPFQVVGVLTRKGQSPQGQDYDDAIYVPASTFRAKIQGGLSKYLTGSILVSARAGETGRAMTQLTALLNERHQTPDGEDEDFSIRDLTEMANASQEGTRTMSMLLASIAAVSLLVGGIGIMNIMLVSVTERTREIGLRMAVGAEPGHILAQFLVEAIALSMAGGLIGALGGAAVAWYLSAQFGWAVALRPDVMALAIGFSALVGVAFGLYPARRASQLNPIEALRFE